MSTLTLVVLGRSRDECCVAGRGIDPSMADELIFVANLSAQWGGLGRIGNHYLAAAQGDVLGLVHADLMLSGTVCTALVAAATGGAIAGVVGRGDPGGIWSRDVTAPTPVSTLDSCSVFVSRATAARVQVSFDEKTFDWFHCCVEDFCLQAAAAGLPVLVVPGWADHPNPCMSSRNGWPVNEHRLYKEKLERKWAGTPFLTT